MCTRRLFFINLKRNAAIVIVIVIILLLYLITKVRHSGNLLGFLYSSDMVDYVAKNLDVLYIVKENSDGRCLQSVILTNTGNDRIVPDDWSIYFYSLRLIEPDFYPYFYGILLSSSGVRIYHHNGYLYEIRPDPKTFQPIKPKGQITLNFISSDFITSTSDIFPNWYIRKHGWKSEVIKSTATNSGNFVAPFNTSAQWKRYEQDKFHPITTKERYYINADIKDIGHAPADRILPTPYHMTLNEAKKVVISPSSWKLVDSNDFTREVKYISEKLQLKTVEYPPNDTYILFKKQHLSVRKHEGDYVSLTWQQAYTLKVDASSNRVLITASTSVGAFYAIQSLLAAGKFINGLFQVPEMMIMDEPRFEYRGLQLDVSRNFQTKMEILKILNTMAIYKLNKFHFHLSDDEGWRLEIPGLKELTEFGSNRCHDDDSDTKCLKPQLGSGPFKDTSGSGFYSVADYKDILRHASSLHIQVIPEIDMPGHAYAAIKSMELRYIKQGKGKQNKDDSDKNDNDAPSESPTEFLLSEIGDNSSYMSIQHFKNNSINPCIASTYTFIQHVIKSIKKMHEDVQPLRMFHYGGDEVPSGAWSKSPACRELIDTDLNIEDRAGLKKYFAKRVFELLEREDLDIGAWEDGLMYNKKTMVRSEFTTNRDIYGYAWQNVWEWNRAHIAYEMANNNYKVVLGHATHLYFDHAQEPNPEEKGLYWATRYTSMRKTFGYLPDDLFGNADYKLTGEAVDLREICHDGCVKLEKPQNIAGMEAHLWSETIRSSTDLEYMLFPRLLAMAERAWHKSDWEFQKIRASNLKKDWTSFVNMIGYKEFGKLDDMGVEYRVPPPGAIVNGNKLMVNCEIPGLTIEYSTDGGLSWQRVTDHSTVDGRSLILLRTRSADNKRYSRVVTWYPESK